MSLLYQWAFSNFENEKICVKIRMRNRNQSTSASLDAWTVVHSSRIRLESLSETISFVQSPSRKVTVSGAIANCRLWAGSFFINGSKQEPLPQQSTARVKGIPCFGKLLAHDFSNSNLSTTETVAQTASKDIYNTQKVSQNLCLVNLWHLLAPC